MHFKLLLIVRPIVELASSGYDRQNCQNCVCDLDQGLVTPPTPHPPGLPSKHVIYIHVYINDICLLN